MESERLQKIYRQFKLSNLIVPNKIIFVLTIALAFCVGPDLRDILELKSWICRNGDKGPSKKNPTLQLLCTDILSTIRIPVIDLSIFIVC